MSVQYPPNRIINSSNHTSAHESRLRFSMMWEMKSLLLCVTTCFVIITLLSGCAKKEEAKPFESKLATFGAVPQFRFTERSDRAMGLDDFKGKIWIADFIFTHCAGPCPLMSTEMSKLQKEFSTVANLRFVSFSVDPERDTPEVLREYASRYEASADRWFFLTGNKEELHSLAYNGFHIGDKDNPVFHSQRLILIDSYGNVRGYYDGLDAEQTARLRQELRILIDEEKQMQAAKASS